MEKFYVYVLQSIPTARLYVGMSAQPDKTESPQCRKKHMDKGLQAVGTHTS